MKKVVDLFQYKLEKEEREKKQNNTELFKRMISTQVKDLTDDELDIYAEIDIHYIFMYKETFRVLSAAFRGNIYLINNLGNGTFEYLGELGEILDIFVLYK